jgi:hypothetical protein
MSPVASDPSVIVADPSMTPDQVPLVMVPTVASDDAEVIEF